MSGRTALVTGGSGFIGRHLVEALLARGDRVRCFVHRRPMPALPVECVGGDLARGEGITDALRGVDVVFHLAGVTKACSSSAYYEGNQRASENLARAASSAPRFVHVSTLAAMGPSIAGKPLTEEAEPRPLSHYGRSKLAAERAVRTLLPNAVIVRPPVVYGPGDTDVFQIFRSAARGYVLAIGAGDSWFSHIYVADLVEALLAAAECPSGETFFVSDPRPVCWREFADVLGRALGRAVKTVRISTPLAWTAGLAAEIVSRFSGKPNIVSRDKVLEARQRWWTCDPSKAATLANWRARVSLEEGITRTVAWYREQGWLK